MIPLAIQLAINELEGDTILLPDVRENVIQLLRYLLEKSEQLETRIKSLEDPDENNL